MSFLTSFHRDFGLPTGLLVNGCHLCVFLTILISGILFVCPNQLSLWDLTLSLLVSYIYGAACKVRNFNLVYIWTYVWQRWKQSLSICCTICQHWINAYQTISIEVWNGLKFSWHRVWMKLTVFLDVMYFFSKCVPVFWKYVLSRLR
jgi:hypothetical protein